MQENELPKNMGKKIVDALKQQDFDANSELNSENSIDNFTDNDELSLDSLDDNNDVDALCIQRADSSWRILSTEETKFSPHSNFQL